MLQGDEFASSITREDFYKILRGKPYERYFKTIRNLLQKVGRNNNKEFDQAEYEQAVQRILSHCWDYYLNCVPAAKKGRRPSGIKRAAKQATDYAKKLRIEAKTIFSAGNNMAIRNVLDAFSLEAMPFLRTLEGFHHACVQIESITISDRGGKNSSVAFTELIIVMAGIYKLATGDDVTTSKRDNFFVFISTVINLLDSAKGRFPSASFDMPPTADALRKALDRAWK